jgi:calcineurin-binding protein cabin-1
MSAEMEGLCQRIIALMPETLDLTASSVSIKNFINGIEKEINSELLISFPSNINCIYYLLADYYFKSRDFIKAIKYYILDLTMHPTRFDSWANLALSKASKVETKLNSCLTLK